MMAARGFKLCRAGFAGRGGLRTTHRRPTLAFRFRPETWVSGRGLARRLRRPRHGLRTAHRRPTPAFRFRPAPWVSVRSILRPEPRAAGRTLAHPRPARAEGDPAAALER